jgi:D-alanyl-D-alanine endopeptidase (penicillin-binding protein 7)
MTSEPTLTYAAEVTDLRRKSNFWIAPFVLAGLISIGLAPAASAQSTTTRRTARTADAKGSDEKVSAPKTTTVKTTTAKTAATKPTAAKITAPAPAVPAAAARKRPVPQRSGAAASAPARAVPIKSTGTTIQNRLYSAQRSLSRTASLAQARAVATAREFADAIVPRYKVDAAGDLVPDLRAEAAIIYNPETKQVLWEENSQSQRSIASITKVMTATVFLENDPDLTQSVTIARSDVYMASTTHLRANDQVTVDDLLHLLLIASDNAAARALARVSPQGSSGFIERMNSKAAELELTSTHYADPSGLLSENVSSAYDMARLIVNASGDDRIAPIMRTAEYTVETPRRSITFRSTNHLLRRGEVDVRAGKTGFISKAGYCLATLLRLPTGQSGQGGQQVAVVVLGAHSNAGRFVETQNLFNWLSSKASTIFATKTPAVGTAE